MRLRVLMVMAITAVVAGCAQTSPPEATDSDGHEDATLAFPERISAPLDDVYLSDEMGVLDMAIDHATIDCLVERGYDVADAKSWVHRPQGPVLYETGFIIRSSEPEARRFGLYAGPVSGEFRYIAWGNSSAFIADQQECSTLAEEIVGGANTQTMIDYRILGSQLDHHEAAVQRRDPSAVDALIECVDDFGFPIHDAKKYREFGGIEPWGFEWNMSKPDDEQSSNDPVHVVTLTNAPDSYTPSERESDFAVAMYRCTIETDLHRQDMENARAAQDEFIAEHGDEIHAMNPTISELAKHWRDELNLAETN